MLSKNQKNICTKNPTTGTIFFLFLSFSLETWKPKKHYQATVRTDVSKERQAKNYKVIIYTKIRKLKEAHSGSNPTNLVYH